MLIIGLILLITDDCWLVSHDDEVQSEDKSHNSTAIGVGHAQPLWLSFVNSTLDSRNAKDLVH